METIYPHGLMLKNEDKLVFSGHLQQILWNRKNLTRNLGKKPFLMRLTSL